MFFFPRSNLFTIFQEGLCKKQYGIQTKSVCLSNRHVFSRRVYYVLRTDKFSMRVYRTNIFSRRFYLSINQTLLFHRTDINIFQKPLFFYQTDINFPGKLYLVLKHILFSKSSQSANASNR